ncbi:FAD-binding oxidoreductase [Candidatus Wolfebacteria bacterium]|nr:FAD-binding oxidoreductase [Candidatus Wolfebacteria bacterium]
MKDDTVIELKRCITGDVYVDEATRAKYATDASLFEIVPQVVVVPRDVDDVRALVRFAGGHGGVSLTARSGGTGMDGGALTESVVVDFNKYFTHMGEVVCEGNTGYVVTEPGVFYRDFEKATLAKNLLMPSYPASRQICTVGGMVANNSGGEETLQYGKTENYVRKLKVVLADGNEYVFEPLTRDALDAKMAQEDFEGELYRKLFALIDGNYELIQRARPKVSKNSAGYYLWNVWNRDTGVFDLTQLFVGSQGTLGLITEITYGLITPAPYSQMMVMFLDDLGRVGDMVGTVLKHHPTTFESYDDKTLKLALKFFWEFVKRLGIPNILTLIVNGIPEGVSMFRHGLPKLVLQITFDGDDRKVLRQKAEVLARELKQYEPRYVEIIHSAKEEEEYWLIRRESFNLLRHKVEGMKTAPFVDDVVVPPDTLSEFLPKLTAIFEPYADRMVYNIAGHIGNGNFHIIPLMDLTDARARAAIPEVAKKVYDLVLSYSGSITGEHNDGIIRTPYLRQQFGDGVCRLFEEVKKIFDPKNIFNPGKKVSSTRSTRRGQAAGTLEYALAHIKTHN